MSSLIKTMYNNHLFHSHDSPRSKYDQIPRFTKVLTKYSTEYNNSVFMISICQKMGMDVKDVRSYFSKTPETSRAELISELECYEITRLDVNRVFKLIGR